MFGFLRRKKPADAAPATAAADTPTAPVADDVAPIDERALEAAALAAAPEDPRTAEAVAQDVAARDPATPAPAAAPRPGFWSRFVPGSKAPAAAPAPVAAPAEEPEVGAPAAPGAGPADASAPKSATDSAPDSATATAPAPAPAREPVSPAASSAAPDPTSAAGLRPGQDAARPAPGRPPGTIAATAPTAPTAGAAPSGSTASTASTTSTTSSAPTASTAPTAPTAPTASPASPAEAPAELVPAPMPDRKPWLARLRQGLSRTSGNIATLFVGVKVDEALFEELEGALLVADAGVETTAWLLAALRERVRRERLADPQQVKAALRALLVELMTPLEQPIDIDRAEPLVMMITGVNGAGKTTSIGKLARHLRREGKSVLLAAGDTFRAAAREQLAQWGSRNEVEVIAQQGGDPAAVAFDAVSAGRARRTGVVMVDTAGRLPTQTHLMDELKKIRRVTAKAMDGAPHEVLLVLDGNTGQNMLGQVKAFDEAVQLTGLVVTKLDGTAKGGALAALAHTRRARPIPVYFIGVGEGIDDLQAFSAEEFAAALVD
jgi:fused signal recognition particle receptor